MYKSPMLAQKEKKMNIAKLRIPLSIYTDATEFTVVGQTLIQKFVENKPTGEVEGIKLELHDATKLDRFTVKVPGQALPFKEDAIESQTIKVSLVNPTITPYINHVNRLDGSVRAEGFKELKKA